MALIEMKRMERTYKENQKVHRPVDSTYSIFEEKGVKYIQIDTYRSDEREFKGKISQSVQITAETLKEILQNLGQTE